MYQAVAALSSESRRFSQAWPTLTWVTTSNVRPRASATVSSANGSRLPPSRDVGRRTPLAIALILPRAGRDEGQDPVRLAEVEAGQDDRLGRVAARDGHRSDGTTGSAVDGAVAGRTGTSKNRSSGRDLDRDRLRTRA